MATRINVGIPHEMPDILRGFICLTVLNRLAQGAGRGVDAAAEVAHVINGPALAFTDHQHFILPAFAALGQFHPQRNIARIGIGDGRGAGDFSRLRRDSAAGERIVFQQVLCCGSRLASLSSWARLSLRYGRSAVKSLLRCEMR